MASVRYIIHLREWEKSIEEPSFICEKYLKKTSGMKLAKNKKVVLYI